MQQSKWLVFWVILLLPSAYASYYGEGIYGSGTYGGSPVASIPLPSSPSGGGGGSILNLDATPLYYTGGNCSEGTTEFEGACYPCDGGELYKKENNQVVCVKCYEGFHHEKGICVQDSNRTSIINFQNLSTNPLGTLTYDWGQKISPNNTMAGVFLLTLLGGGTLYWFSTRKIKWKGEVEKEEKEEKEDE